MRKFINSLFNLIYDEAGFLFQRVNQTDPERVFVIVKNSYSTASLAANQWVAWDTITDEDGIGVTKCGGELRMASMAGVAVETIAAGAYGLVQVWGYRATARMSGGSGLVTSKISEGTYLHIKTSGFAVHGYHGVTSAASVTPFQMSRVGAAMSPANTAAKATSATTWIGKCFVRCL